MSTPNANPRQFAAVPGSGNFEQEPSAGRTTDAARSGVGGAEDYFDTEEYQTFVAECAKQCRCTHTVCAGVLAGGFCDELVEDDSDEENYPGEDDDE